MDMVDLPLISAFTDTERRFLKLTGQPVYTMGDLQTQQEPYSGILFVFIKIKFA